MQQHSLMDFVSLMIIASLVVLVITHPSGFAQDIASLGNYSLAQTSLFAGGQAPGPGAGRTLG